AGSVSPGAEHRDEVARLGAWQRRVIGETIERGAQATHDTRLFLWRGIEPRGDGDGIIAPHHCAEVARSGELVMETAVGNEEHRPVALFSIHDAGQVNTRLAHE